ncbi:MAG: hypothetical protein HC905_26040 [Bacteroidales bacterium]|nr:hypothetical protein [Bacteroidales bacterium]
MSRWLNTVTVKIQDTALLQKLDNFSFVKKTIKSQPIRIVLNQTEDSQNPYSQIYDSAHYGASYRQIHMHYGEFLHNRELRGENMLISVIDAGFNNYQTMSSFNNLLSENRILAVRDFVNHDGEVNSDHSHGSQVLSIIAGKLEG